MLKEIRIITKHIKQHPHELPYIKLSDARKLQFHLKYNFPARRDNMEYSAQLFGISSATVKYELHGVYQLYDLLDFRSKDFFRCKMPNTQMLASKITIPASILNNNITSKEIHSKFAIYVDVCIENKITPHPTLKTYKTSKKKGKHH